MYKIEVTVYFIDGTSLAWDCEKTKEEFLKSIDLEKRFITIEDTIINTDNVEYIEVTENE